MKAQDVNAINQSTTCGSPIKIYCLFTTVAAVSGLHQTPPCNAAVRTYYTSSFSPNSSSHIPKLPITTLDRDDGTKYAHPIRRRTTHTLNKFTRLEMTSTSGIDQLPDLVQASVFVAVYAALGLATVPTSNLLNGVSKSTIGLERWRDRFIETSLPLSLGAFYLLAGIGHFVAMDAFASIYPPIGTWGLWYLPGSASFHVAWTGIVEALGGIGLLIGGGRNLLGVGSDENEDGADSEGGLLTFDKLAIPLSALTLFLLTVIVTPANIYMYTHGAMMGDTSPPFDLSFHLVRFVVQVIVLSLLLTLSRDSFFFAWGDELD